MRYTVRINQRSPREFVAHTVGEPDCNATGTTRDEALNNIREELRYRVEYCPCAFVTDDYVQLDVVE